MLLYKEDQAVAETAALAVELGVNESNRVLLLAVQILCIQLDMYKLRLRKVYMQSTIRMLRNLPLLNKNRYFMENSRALVELPFYNYDTTPNSMGIVFALTLRSSQNRDTNSIGLLKLKDVKGIEPTACNINLMRNSPSQGDFCRKMAGRYEAYILQHITNGTKLTNLLGIILEFDCEKGENNIIYSSPSPDQNNLNSNVLVTPQPDEVQNIFQNIPSSNTSFQVQNNPNPFQQNPYMGPPSYNMGPPPYPYYTAPPCELPSYSNYQNFPPIHPSFYPVNSEQENYFGPPPSWQ